MWQKIKNYYHLLQAQASAIFYNFPSKSLIVIGVTGTDGKTTTVHMIYEILKKANKKVSMVSSVAAIIGSKTIDTGFHVTTPSSWQVQRFLRQAVDSGCQYFILEATSHGLDQNRLAHVKFKVAVITNITHEHMDYHKTWPKYAQAKARLFENADFSILNRDDASFKFLKSRASGRIKTYAIRSSADFTLKNFPIRLKIIGYYNLSNALAAVAVSSVLEISKVVIHEALSTFRGVPGRMEEIRLGQNFKVIVDFAHTPNALEQALRTLRSTINDRRSAKIIAVFGAAGERDQTKRPLIGKVAEKFADIIILTAEDPRGEEVKDICEQIASQIKDKKKNEDLFIIPDRRRAIETALSKAQQSDTVVILGKGHEKSMTYGQQDLPWDEIKVVKDALARRLHVQ